MQRNVTDGLTAAVRDWGARNGVSFAGKTVLCAVSGGRDSMALLHILLRLGTEQGFAVVAAHYNHRLRETAARDEGLVRDWCASRGVPVVIGGGDVRVFAERSGRSIEDAARVMRYDFLEKAAEESGADFIATAHHRQDNAETLLLHLLRGSGLQGLGGIAPVRGCIVRPLLEVDRAAIDAYVDANAIPFAEDETNADAAYTRNCIRLKLLPLLEEIAPGSVGRIADAAVRLREDEAFLQKQSEERIPASADDGCVCVPVTQIFGSDRALAVRAVRAAARKCGAELTAPQTDAVLHLRAGAYLALSGGVRVAREGEILRFYRKCDVAAPMALTLGEHSWGDWRVSVFETADEVEENTHTAVFRSGMRDLEISVWDGGGRLGVENGSRTVKRLLADHRIAAARREDLPAIFSGGTLAAVFGAGTDAALRPMPGEIKLVVSIQKKNL